ncbi:hypothetical protein ACIA8E_05285 [Streptomyces sp. NPDC051664]|uniref:hypothetical protein n=1 Tax=Streptomyces sp. NPDC051664 TaxID=3365668 RepID=UPI0037945339
MTDALEHAPGAQVRAEVDHGDETVAVWPMPLLAGAGGGLQGIAERTPEGGFRVRATVSVHRPGGAGNQGLQETETT